MPPLVEYGGRLDEVDGDEVIGERAVIVLAAVTPETVDALVLAVVTPETADALVVAVAAPETVDELVVAAVASETGDVVGKSPVLYVRIVAFS